MMNVSRDELLETLLALPPSEREEIVRELVFSLEGEVDADHESAWVHELKRRLAEVDSGKVELLDWADVRARIEEKLRSPRG